MSAQGKVSQAVPTPSRSSSAFCKRETAARGCCHCAEVSRRGKKSLLTSLLE